MDENGIHFDITIEKELHKPLQINKKTEIFKMAWYETYKIGCGMKTDCIDSTSELKHMLFVVCHYDPR